MDTFSKIDNLEHHYYYYYFTEGVKAITLDIIKLND